LLIDCVRDEEDQVTITNAAVAERACALAEASGGLQRMAALCVSAAAATTGTFRGARKALEAVPHSGLRDAAQVLLNQLADRPAAAEVAATTRGCSASSASVSHMAVADPPPLPRKGPPSGLDLAIVTQTTGALNL
jgi:hypothetical protein